VQRTPTVILAFALAAALATILSAALAYEGLRSAFEREFEARVARLADFAASEVSAEDVADVRRLGAESGGFFALQAQLDMLASAASVANLAIVDTSRVTLYDVRLDERGVLARSGYDSLAHAALGRAVIGERSAAAFRRAGVETRAAFTPVRSGGRVVAVLVAEAQPTWAPELLRLRHRLMLVALFSVAAIAVLAGILMRATTRQLALERRLSRSENLAAMGRLTASLAHEIKNPLAIIRGSAKRLGKLEPEAERMAESVVEEVDRLGRTVTRYLQFARSEAQEEGRGDLTTALNATLDLLEGEFRARRCTLERTGLDVPAPVRLEPESLKQVGLNLVLNALEALPEGGLVRVTLELAPGDAVVRVEDDGPGIPPEVLRRVGEPFFTTRAQGTGLGLFLSRRLAERAGGTLRVESRPGRGTTVTIRLPLARG
jgi:signal transduction histidine kinase